MEIQGLRIAPLNLLTGNSNSLSSLPQNVVPLFYGFPLASLDKAISSIRTDVQPLDTGPQSWLKMDKNLKNSNI